MFCGKHINDHYEKKTISKNNLFFSFPRIHHIYLLISHLYNRYFIPKRKGKREKHVAYYFQILFVEHSAKA